MPMSCNGERGDARRGIALPMMLLMTILLTVSLGAGFLIASGEHGVSTDHDAELKAYTVAQEGIERYLTDVTALPAALPDTRTISVGGGTATVTLRVFRSALTAGIVPIYAITSVGQATARDLRRAASDAVPERSISQMVIWQPGTIDVQAAFTSMGTLNAKNGVSGTVSGVNQCATGVPAVIAGLVVPNDSLLMNSHNTNFIDGNPDNTPVYIGTPGPTGTAADSVATQVDWAGILNGTTGISPDFTLDRTTSQSKYWTGTWPTAAQFNNWPVVMVKGSITNGDNFTGNGVLIVTGNADLTNITWHGIVMIGGEASLSGSATKVYGALYTGLNVLLGQTVPETVIGNGNMLVQYNSCDVSRALQNYGGWRRLQNTWADNWPSYTVP